MPRSRSRSPRRDRHSRRRKSRSRSPRGGSRRYRSRSPRRRRSRSPSPRRRRSPPNYRPTVPALPPTTSKPTLGQPITSQMTLGGSLGVTGKRKKKKQNQQLSMAHLEDMTDEDKSMQQIMGFGGFDTTKGKKVKGNDVYAINKKVERKYRQYMNRKGGFNRPLEKIA